MTLGADIPVCMSTGLTLMEGAGEQITHLSPAPNWGLLLVNPNVGVSTPAVFHSLRSKNNPQMQDTFEKCQDIAWLCHQRNDLEPPAVALVPDVAAVIDAISATPQCQVARMSGSGATCFGIFPTRNQAQTAAQTLQHAHPDWWVVSTTLV